MSNWQEMFDQRKNGGPPAVLIPEAKAETAEPDDGIAPPPNPLEYKPWILQRGRGRPTMFIDFRRFESKSGLLIGCQMSYPSLMTVEYVGDCMVTLDFGLRQFVIEGKGLQELARYLQQGIVVAIQEFSEKIWLAEPSGTYIARIVQICARNRAGNLSEEN